MTDINGIPVIQPESELVRGIVVAQVPVELPQGRIGFEIKLRAPGIVRGVGFWLKQPKVWGPNMRGIQAQPMPVLFVESAPNGELVTRRFAFVPSDTEFDVATGHEAVYRGMAMGGHGVGHLFEIVEKKPTISTWEALKP